MRESPGAAPRGRRRIGRTQRRQNDAVGTLELAPRCQPIESSIRTPAEGGSPNRHAAQTESVTSPRVALSFLSARGFGESRLAGGAWEAQIASQGTAASRRG